MSRLPPTSAEQRLEYLKDTQSLISPGFLAERVVVGGVSICFRSPHPSDYFILSYAFHSEDKEWSVALIARMVWMVDGYVFFSDPKTEYEIRDLLHSLPKAVFNKLFQVCAALIKRMVEARSHLLYYLFESSSRDLWRGIGKRTPNADILTGISGLEKIGLNASQRIWVAWNQAEDQRDRDEYDWQLTKQNIAPHAPKAIEKMNKQEKQREETRQRDRQKKQDEWYYKATGVLDANGKIIVKETGEEVDPYAGDQVSMAYTSDELAEEMRRWVVGEQDWHDKVIAEYKANIKQKMLDERMERDKRLAEAQLEMEQRERDLGMRTRDRLVGYTPDQVAQLRNDDPQRPGARQISYAPSRKQSAFDKWVDTERNAGALVEEDGKLVAKKEIPRPKKDERSLQDKINSRLPRLDRGD